MLRFVFFVAVVFTASSCMLPLGFQTAKTLEEDEFLSIWAADISGTVRRLPTNRLDPLGLEATPFWSLAFRSGMRAKNMDWGLHLSWASPLGADVKYQFAGDRESLFAAATGLGLGWVPRVWSYDSYNSLDNKSLLAVTVPLFLTLDFNDKTSFTFATNYRYAVNSVYSFHAAVFNLNMRFRTKNTEDLRRYFTIDLFAGRSFVGTANYDNLLFGGITVSFQNLTSNMSARERLKRKRKKKQHKVFFEY